MKNLYYVLLALGVIAIIAGIYLFVSATAASPHHLSKFAALIVGVVLLLIGAYGAFIAKPRTA